MSITHDLLPTYVCFTSAVHAVVSWTHMDQLSMLLFHGHKSAWTTQQDVHANSLCATIQLTACGKKTESLNQQRVNSLLMLCRPCSQDTHIL